MYAGKWIKNGKTKNNKRVVKKNENLVSSKSKI